MGWPACTSLLVLCGCGLLLLAPTALVQDTAPPGSSAGPASSAQLRGSAREDPAPGRRLADLLQDRAKEPHKELDDRPPSFVANVTRAAEDSFGAARTMIRAPTVKANPEGIDEHTSDKYDTDKAIKRAIDRTQEALDAYEQTLSHQEEVTTADVQTKGDVSTQIILNVIHLMTFGVATFLVYNWHHDARHNALAEGKNPPHWGISSALCCLCCTWFTICWPIDVD